MSESAETARYVPNWSMKDVLNVQREVAEQERKVQTEQAFLRNIWRRAKDAGMPVEVIKAVNKQRKREQPDALIYLHQYIRISAANGIRVPGPQGDIFDQAEYTPTPEEQHIVALHRAEQEGWDAGRRGLGQHTNPYEGGTEENQTWALWWGRGAGAAKYANGGVAPVVAKREQPAARMRERAVTVLGEDVTLKTPSPPELTEEEVEVVAEAMAETPGRRSRRPNGAVAPKVAKPRGRPKGSKNRPKEMHV